MRNWRRRDKEPEQVIGQIIGHLGEEHSWFREIWEWEESTQSVDVSLGYIFIFIIDWLLVLGIKLRALHKLEKLLTSELHCPAPDVLTQELMIYSPAWPWTCDLQVCASTGTVEGWTIIVIFCIFIDLGKGSGHLTMTFGGPWGWHEDLEIQVKISMLSIRRK